jgi:hypothetical protein
MARIFKRERVWYIDVRYKGRRIRRRVGASKRIAELALSDAVVRIEREEFGFAKKCSACLICPRLSFAIG